MFQKFSNFYTLIFGIFIIIVRMQFRYLNSLISNEDRSDTKVNISLKQDIVKVMFYVIAVLTVVIERNLEVLIGVSIQIALIKIIMLIMQLDEISVMNYNRKRQIKPRKNEIKEQTLLAKFLTAALLVIGYMFIFKLIIKEIMIRL